MLLSGQPRSWGQTLAQGPSCASHVSKVRRHAPTLSPGGEPSFSLHPPVAGPAWGECTPSYPLIPVTAPLKPNGKDSLGIQAMGGQGCRYGFSLYPQCYTWASNQELMRPTHPFPLSSRGGARVCGTNPESEEVQELGTWSPTKGSNAIINLFPQPVPSVYAGGTGVSKPAGRSPIIRMTRNWPAW